MSSNKTTNFTASQSDAQTSLVQAVKLAKKHGVAININFFVIPSEDERWRSLAAKADAVADEPTKPKPVKAKTANVEPVKVEPTRVEPVVPPTIPLPEQPPKTFVSTFKKYITSPFA